MRLLAARVTKRVLRKLQEEAAPATPTLLGNKIIPQTLILAERRAQAGTALKTFQALLTARRDTPLTKEQGPPVDPLLLEAAIRARVNRDTGFMGDSIRVTWTGSEYEVRSPGCPYMRIQNWGGYAGKNGAAHLAGHYFVEKGASAVGVSLDLVTIPEDFDG